MTEKQGDYGTEDACSPSAQLGVGLMPTRTGNTKYATKVKEMSPI